MASSSEKSKILVIGATGYIGNFIVEASANLGHCTFALVRESVLDDPTKLQTLEHLKSLGVNLLFVRQIYVSCVSETPLIFMHHAFENFNAGGHS